MSRAAARTLSFLILLMLTSCASYESISERGALGSINAAEIQMIQVYCVSPDERINPRDRSATTGRNYLVVVDQSMIARLVKELAVGGASVKTPWQDRVIELAGRIRLELYRGGAGHFDYKLSEGDEALIYPSPPFTAWEALELPRGDMRLLRELTELACAPPLFAQPKQSGY